MRSITLADLRTLPASPPLTPLSIYGVLFCTGLLGFILGAWGNPNYQHAVEGAQAVSGLVGYPSPSPFHIYQIKAWTALHQVLGIFLRIGIPEMILSFVVSGFIAMLSFQALAMASLAFSEDIVFAVLFPFCVQFTGAFAFGPTYLIHLLSTFATYGVAGLSWIILAITLISLERYRLGGFLLGIAPAIHPAFAVMGVVSLLCAFLVNRLVMKENFIPRRLVSFFFAGLALTLVSYFYYLKSTKNIAPISGSEAARYLDVFVKKWDGHRIPISLIDPGTLIFLAYTALCSVSLCITRPSFLKKSLLLVSLGITSGMLGIAAIILTWLPPDKVPDFILVSMPGKILDLNIFLFPPFVYGLLMRSGKDSLPARIFMILSLLILIKCARFSHLYPGVIASILIVTGALAVCLAKGLFTHLEFKIHFPKAFLNPLIYLILTAVLIKSFAMAAQTRREQLPQLLDYRNDPFWSKVSEDRGMLLTAPDLNLIQLKSKRPVLLEAAAIDGLPYALESGPFMNTILNEVYGTDLFKDTSNPEESLIDEDQLETLWEKRTPKDWHELAYKFDFSSVLTRTGYRLSLPVKAKNSDYILYDIELKAA